ncbi:MAG: SET domain-containing protein-lysine N-methyltransferase [Candidatus Delongbacteria bacterium]|nr:SET domain-containing protein-lysine N-methyltransferase [Candidatus Delongbacteria bacterium]
MIAYNLKRITDKGFGLFTDDRLVKNQLIFRVNLNIYRKFSPQQLKVFLSKNPEIDDNHVNHAGKETYVLEETPASYLNHSCDPNCYFNFLSETIYEVRAFREIEKGEELTHDYTASTLDQFNDNEFWKMKCNCNSKNCRKIITGDFYKMPIEWQDKFKSFLPEGY